MTTLRPRDIINGLHRKGFEPAQRDHIHMILFVDGKKTNIWTKVSHGSGGRTIDDSLINKMARQVKLDKQQFLDLINCPMSFETYIQILDEQGIHLHSTQSPSSPSAR